VRQIPGVRGVVSALYDVPVGEVWAKEEIERLAGRIDAAGLKLSVIESIPYTKILSWGELHAIN
jgi:mannonate dehydratase